MSKDKEALGRALGRIPSGLFIVTARHEDRTSALLASWVQQAGFDPPAVSVAVGQGRPVGELIGAGAAFAVNVVAAGEDDLVKHFAKGFAPGEDPYDGVATARGTTGVAVLTQALASLECLPRGSVGIGDHVLFLGEVVNAWSHRDEGDPAVHLRKSGLHY